MASFLVTFITSLHIPFVYSISYTAVQSEDYFSCGLAAGGQGALTSDDICFVNCNQEYQSSIQNVFCGEVGFCFIQCNHAECLMGATIHSNRTSQTHIIPRAAQCLKNSVLFAGGNTTIKVPIGNASGNSINTMETLYGMEIYSDYAHSISITCRGPVDFDPANAECVNMTIYAETSQRFELIASADYTNVRGTEIHCPDNSNYELSCFVDATGRFVMAENLHIYADGGTPRDVVFEGGAPGGGYGEIAIYCDYGTSVLNDDSDGSFQNVGDCWNTPTNEPTPQPIMTGTPDPTPYPSHYPTAPTMPWITTTTWYPILNNHSFNCTQASGGAITSDETCYITCSAILSQTVESVSCGTAGRCIIECGYSQCLKGAAIYATDAQSLEITSYAGHCMRDSTIYAPDNGNVTITIPSEKWVNSTKTFYGMTVYSAENTKSISITCNAQNIYSSTNLECANMSIHAESADYFELNAMANYTNIRGTEITCPDANSAYEGSEEASCVIRATGRYVFADSISIWTYFGSPQDVVLYGSDSANYYGSYLYCKDGNSSLESLESIQSGDCWITLAPTASPSNDPTNTPTAIPTSGPTPNPTSQLTTEPTADPTEFNNLLSENSAETQSGWIMIVISCLAVLFVVVLVFAIWRVLGPRRRNTAEPKLVEIVNSNTTSGSGTTSVDDLESPGTPHAVPAEYVKIVEILKECDANRWEEILQNFMNEKVTDKAMEFMPCDPKDDCQDCWKDLLPELGVRVMFKTLWNERNSNHNEDDDEMYKPTTTMGIDLDEEGPVSPTLQSAVSDEGVVESHTAGDTNAACAEGDV